MADLAERIFDEDGYDEQGYNRNGYDCNGFDRDGYDCDGYDEDGLDADGYDRDGVDSDGYDRDGNYVGEGYGDDGYDKDGFDEEGYDRDGYDREGYDETGFNSEGYNKDGDSRLVAFAKSASHKVFDMSSFKSLEESIQYSITHELTKSLIGPAYNVLSSELGYLKDSYKKCIDKIDKYGLTVKQYDTYKSYFDKHMKKILDKVYIAKKGRGVAYFLLEPPNALHVYFFGKDSIMLRAYYTRCLDKLDRIANKVVSTVNICTPSQSSYGVPSIYDNSGTKKTFAQNSTYSDWDLIVSRYKKEIEINLRSWVLSNKYMSPELASIQMGFIFEGPPGSGKSTMAKGIAGLLGYSILYIDLAADVEEQFSKIGRNMVVVMEDIDLILGTVKNESTERTVMRDKNTNIKLSKIMNLIDGKVKYDHVIFIMTTNNIKAIDYALKRPGRIDEIYTIGYLNEKEIRGICKKRGVKPEGILREFTEPMTPADLKKILDKFLARRKLYYAMKLQEFIKYKLEQNEKEKESNE